MTGHAPRCENCGSPLPIASAVCSRCEAELAAPTQSTSVGRYQCPNCGSRFDMPAQTWYPPNVPWYWPQRVKAQCPHCRSFLRDTKSIHLSTVEYAVLTSLIVVANFSPWRPWTQVALLVAFLALMFVRFKKLRSSQTTEERRYAAETSRP